MKEAIKSAIQSPVCSGSPVEGEPLLAAGEEDVLLPVVPDLPRAFACLLTGNHIPVGSCIVPGRRLCLCDHRCRKARFSGGRFRVGGRFMRKNRPYREKAVRSGFCIRSSAEDSVHGT